MASFPDVEDGMSMVVMGRYGVLYTRPRPKPSNETPKVVDLRSDTVTKPTEEMRVAMFEAEVGDDVFEEDPTVQQLERKAAETLGKEAGLFVPSGTMGNLIAAMTHCWGRGEEMLLGDQSHIATYEQGGLAQIGHVHTETVKNLPDGTLDLDEIERKIKPDDVHKPITRLVVVENSHNLLGGRVIHPEYMDKLAQLISGRGIKLHVDGARLFNAATALGLPASKLVEHADSATFCLSKGLGAPVGSVLVGPTDFIMRARRVRKSLGGGMRQVGVLAAPGLIALEKMSQRLDIDHNMAQVLAKGLAAMADLGVVINPEAVETNIVIFGLQRSDMTTSEFVSSLEEEGDVNGEKVIIRMCTLGKVKIRAVLNYHVDRNAVDLALIRTREVLGNRGGRSHVGEKSKLFPQ